MPSVCKMWFVIVLGLCAASCAPIKIKDHEFYGDMGKFGAVKVHSLFTEIPPVRIYQPEWDQMRIGMVCTSADTIADIQATVDKLCTRSNQCDYEEMQKARSSMRNLLTVQRRFGVKVKPHVMRVFEFRSQATARVGDPSVSGSDR